MSTKTVSKLLPVGTKVGWLYNDSERSTGIIIAYNHNNDLFYGKDRFPYLIAWNDGCTDVYSSHSFKVISGRGL